MSNEKRSYKGGHGKPGNGGNGKFGSDKFGHGGFNQAGGQGNGEGGAKASPPLGLGCERAESPAEPDSALAEVG